MNTLAKVQSVEARIWSKVDQAGPDDCWLWTGRFKAEDLPNRYGLISIGPRGENVVVLAHRAVWMLVHGQDPGPLRVLHSCDNPPCCNPAHLRLGTSAENSRDMVERGRSAIGERNGMAVVTAEQVCEIRRLFKTGVRQRDLMARFGLPRSTVFNIVRRKSWTHLSEEDT